MEENPYWAPFDRRDAKPVPWLLMFLVAFGALCQMCWPIAMLFNRIAGIALLVVGVITLQTARRKHRRERDSA